MKTEDFLANLLRLLAESVRFGKQIGVNQTQKMRELVFVAVMRCRGEQEDVVGLAGELGGEFVAFGRVWRWLAPRAAGLGACRTFVRLVDDDEIPSLLPDAFPHRILFGVVQ